MALSKVASFGKCIILCEQIAMQALRQTLLADNSNSEIGWLHRTTSANDWDNLGLEPEIELTGAIFVRTTLGVVNEVVHAKVYVRLSQSQASIVERYVRRYPKEYDVNEVVVTLRRDVGSKKMEIAHGFAFQPSGVCAHPAEEFRLIPLPN